MLTQELSRYKERYWGSSPPRWPHIPHQQHHNQHQVIGGHCAMGKLDYDLFLQNLDIQVGDLVSYRVQVDAAVMNRRSLATASIFRVDYIEMMHRLVEDWGTIENGPKVITLCDPSLNNGTHKWRGYARMWKKIPSYLIPESHKQYARPGSEPVQSPERA
jgi:hypothetical protein